MYITNIPYVPVCMYLLYYLYILYYTTDELAVTRKLLNEVIESKNIAEKAQIQLQTYNNTLTYLSYENICINIKDSHFTYNVCLLGKITQIDDESPEKRSVTLGTFRSIEEEKSVEKSVENDSSGSSSGKGGGGGKGGHVLIYKDGTPCYNFGARSAEVHVICGVENKLLSAREPSTCFYTLEMTSPAACSHDPAPL